MRKSPKTTKARLRTAYHEAGHAVMSYIVHVTIREASIQRSKQTLGHVRTFDDLLMRYETSANVPLLITYDSDRERKVRQIIEKHVLIFFAGAASERIALGRCSHLGMYQDLTNSGDLLHLLAPDDDEKHAYMRWLFRRATSYLKVPYYWAAVEAIKAELLSKERIGARATYRCIKGAIEQYKPE